MPEDKENRISRKATLEQRLQFAENLKKYRMQRHMSQEQLAQLIGTSVFSISRWERAKHHPPRTTIKLLKLIGVL